MSEQLKQIAERIKELRNIAGLGEEELAAKLDIPVDTYREYESGNVDIPVSFLYKISGMFNVKLTAILTGEGPKLHTYSLVRAGKGISVERRKEYKYQSLAYNFANKKAEPFLVTVEPEDEDSEVRYNSHTGQEFNYVLEGRMKVIINGHEIILNEGDSLFFNSGIDHAMKALDGKPAKFLAVIM